METMENTRITYVRNDYDVKVRRCCASCQQRLVKPDGNRVCTMTMTVVEQKHRCRRWQMSDGMRNAGLQNGGVVRLRETKETIIG